MYLNRSLHLSKYLVAFPAAVSMQCVLLVWSVLWSSQWHILKKTTTKTTFPPDTLNLPLSLSVSHLCGVSAAELFQCKRTYSSLKLHPLMHHAACLCVCVRLWLWHCLAWLYFYFFSSASPRLVLFIFLFSSACALTGLASVSPDWAFGPWQWKLEWLEEVEDAPADDDVVIEAHETANLFGKGNKTKQGVSTVVVPRNESLPRLDPEPAETGADLASERGVDHGRTA